jgi:hypothetical protein
MPDSSDLRKLQGVSVGLSLRLESAPAPAEDRNALFSFAFDDDDRRPRHPFASAKSLGIKLHPVPSVNFAAH